MLCELFLAEIRKSSRVPVIVLTARIDKRTGLGLAIAKELAARMGGEIFAKKEKGLLVIRVSLPRLQ